MWDWLIFTGNSYLSSFHVFSCYTAHFLRSGVISHCLGVPQFIHLPTEISTPPLLGSDIPPAYRHLPSCHWGRQILFTRNDHQAQLLPSHSWITPGKGRSYGWGFPLAGQLESSARKLLCLIDCPRLGSYQMVTPFLVRHTWFSLSGAESPFPSSSEYFWGLMTWPTEHKDISQIFLEGGLTMWWVLANQV